MKQAYNRVNGDHKIIHGNCLEELKLIESAQVDLVYFDPPFFTSRSHHSRPYKARLGRNIDRNKICSRKGAVGTKYYSVPTALKSPIT